MNIPFVPADPSNYYSGRGGNSIKYIVMHYTANDGDTDEGNAHYFQGAGRRASAHYFVDEDSVTQSVRDNDAAWHCGGDLESSHHPLRGICMNRNSLGVEMCSDIVGGKYTITPQTVDRAVELVKHLMAKYGIDADVKNSLVADGCVIEGTVENCVLFRGVKIEKGAKVKNCILMQDTTVGAKAEMNFVITDKNVTISEYRSLAGTETYPVFVNKGATV